MKSIIIGLIFLLCTPISMAQSSPEKDSSFKPYGELNLLSNYTRYGITQTNKDPSFQTAFGFKWGNNNGRLGLWGSNVRYENENAHLNLKGFVSYKIVFGSNSNVDIKYNLDRFYGSNSRDGTNLIFDFEIYKYHVSYLADSNFEGANIGRVRYGFGKEWQIPKGLFADLEAGYNSISSDTYSSYFDLKPSLIYKSAPMKYFLSMSYHSSPGQYNGRADLFFLLGTKGEF